MARRRRRNNSVDAGCLIAAVVFIPAGLVLIFIASHPILLLPLTAGGVGLGVWRFSVRQDRKRQVEQYKRQQAVLQDARSRVITNYYMMSAREFEEALAYLCQRDGCFNTLVVGKSGDLGADVTAMTPDGRK